MKYSILISNNISLASIGLFIITTCAGIVNSQSADGGSYILVGPKIIRPNSNYKVAVQNLVQGTTLDLEAKISRNNVIPEPKSVLQGSGSFGGPNGVGSKHFLTIKVPNHYFPDTSDDSNTGGQLFLTISKKGSGIILKTAPDGFNSTILDPNTKIRSVFIQTDKYKYKPGDKVRLRVIIVDSRLRPRDETVSIFITDPNGNRIKQWTNSTTKTGVISLELNLANKALEGSWTITCESSSAGGIRSSTKNFQVEEYVLPTFDVKLMLPTYAVIQRGNIISISGTFEAKYTFGGSVPGKAIIVMEDQYGYYVPETGSYKREKVQLSLDAPTGTGKFDLKLDLSNKDYINEDSFTYGRPVTVTLGYLDSLTLTSRNATQDVTVYVTAVKLTIAGPPYYKPSLPYNLKITASQMDDKPLRPEDPHSFLLKSIKRFDRPSDIKRKMAMFVPDKLEYSTETVLEKNYTVDETGVAYLTLYELGNNLLNVDFQAYFHGDKRIAYHSAKRFDEPINAYIKLLLDQSNQEELLKLGGVAKFKVISNVPLQTISLIAVSKGDIVHFSTADGKNRTKISFTVGIISSFVPNPTFVIYTNHGGQIIADSIQTRVDRLTENRINISLEVSELRPGQEANFKIQSGSNSLICLLAVDQSVKLLAEGNDLSRGDIAQEIDFYSNANNGRFGGSFNRRRRQSNFGIRWWWPTSGSSAKIFEDAGLFVITDAKLYQTVTAPPLYFMRVFGSPGPVAFKSTSIAESADLGSSRPQPSVVTRKEFPETWIWTDTYTDANGQLIVKHKVPDTITTWVTTGFSINPSMGLAITDSPTNLLVKLPFFVTLNLPYSVIRGEIVRIQAIVFNYVGQVVQAQVTLAPHESYELVDKLSSNLAQVSVPSDSGASVYFTIKPLIVGNVVLKVTALSGNAAGDSLEKLLLVKAEGETLYFNKPLFLNLKPGTNIKEDVTLKWDKGNMVPGSNHLEASAIGDIIGPSLSNIGNLIRMPYGCGEQNMLNFAPNIYIYSYLKARGILNSQTAAKITAFTEQGYQRQLTYQRNDGSFSAFGNSDPKGSVWLTSFVLLSFARAHASGLIYVDPGLITKAAQFVRSQQAEDGAFRETGEVHHKPMQGGASQGIALTAFVFLALNGSQVFENSSDPKVAQAATRGKTYMIQSFKSGLISDKPYELSIVTYALQQSIGDRDVAESALKALLSLAKTVEGGNKYWKADPTTPPCPTKNCFYQAVSLDFEATSYALLTLSKLKMLEEGLPIMRWLVSQRSSLGGYSSTQDTVVAMQALSEYASLLSTGEQNIVIDVVGDLLAHEFTITPTNALILDTFVFSGLENVLTISAKGVGTALLQVSWSYNVANKSIPNGFDIDSGTRIVGSSLQTEICYRYLGKGRSNMAILEINSLSGYVFAADTSNNIKAIVKDIKLGEVENGATKYNIYFTSVPDIRQCLTVTMNRLYDVKDLKPSLIKLSDYYQPEFKGVTYICSTPTNATKC